MAQSTANVKVYSSAIPMTVWSGLALVAIAIAIMWVLPQARLIVGLGLAVGVILAVAMVIVRQRKSLAGDHDEAAPLHLRD